MMRVAAVLLGVALLAWLVVSSGVSSILADLGRIGPRLLVVLALELLSDGFNVLGWWFVLPVAARAGAYGWLYWVRSAGSALSEATLTASLGGEAAKLLLLRRRMSSAAAAASLLAARLAFSSSKVVFIAAGLAVVLPRLVVPREASLALLAGFVLVLLGVVTFAAIQARGVGPGTLNVLRHARVPVRWIARADGWLQGVDVHLRDLYRGRARDLLRAVGAHFCGFACGTLQLLLLMGWLGLPFDPAAALGAEAFAVLIGFVMFVVPGALGVQEGGRVLIFAMLGLPRSAAVAVGLTFRVISLIEIAVRLTAWIVLQHRMRGAPAGSRTMRDPARVD